MKRQCPEQEVSISLLPIARSLHCIRVPIPRCARDSAKVTSIHQGRTNHVRILTGVSARSVESKAHGSNSPNTSPRVEVR